MARDDTDGDASTSDGYVTAAEIEQYEAEHGEPHPIFTVDHRPEREPVGRSRTRVGHCKADDTDVYAGRGQNGRDLLSVLAPGMRGWLGNPFSLEDGYDREESIELYREAFEEKLERDKAFREAVAALSGKTLGCWCQHLDEDDPACHATVIAEWADRLAGDRRGASR